MTGPFETSLTDVKIFSKAKRNHLLFLLFLLALALKLFIFFSVSTPIFFSKYPFFADRINKGVDIGERLLDLSPLYLYGMALLQRLYGPNWEAMVIFQVLAGSLTVLAIFLIGEKLFNRAVGVIAAVLLIFYGNLTLFELTLEPDIFVLLFNSIFILTLLQAAEKKHKRISLFSWFLSGGVLGLSVITKANGLLVLPGIVCWIWWSIHGFKDRMQSVLLFFLGLALIVLPVTVRNILKFSDPVLVTADMGKVFYHGNGPGATGMERADLPDQGFMEESGDEPDYAHVMFRNTARRLTHKDLKPSECSRFWVSRTLAFMQTQPFFGFGLLGKKALLFWQNYEVHDLDTTYAYYQAIRSWPLIPFGFLSALGLMGMVLSAPKIKQSFPLYVMILVYLLTVIIFFDASRYRMPAVPFLCLFAAVALVVMIHFLQQRAFIASLLWWVTALIIFLLTVFPFKKETDSLDRWQQATRIHYNLGGNGYFRAGKYKEAIVEYQKTVTLAPGFAPAYNQLGKSYALINETTDAEKNFLKVIQLSPEVDQGYMNLGLLYLLRGETARAVPYLKKAYALNPGNRKVKEALKSLPDLHP